MASQSASNTVRITSPCGIEQRTLARRVIRIRISARLQQTVDNVESAQLRSENQSRFPIDERSGVDEHVCLLQQHLRAFQLIVDHSNVQWGPRFEGRESVGWVEFLVVIRLV